MIPNKNNLLSLLSNNDVTFYIPPYQRNYEWETEQCEVFINDIKRTAEAGAEGERTEHFFGSVTFFKTKTAFGQPSKLVLIDGQQRITTTMLFLIALRNIVGNEDTEKFIDNKYLKNNNVVDDTEYKIKLKQVESDWSVYKNLVLREEIPDSERQTAVYRNYSYFRGKLLKLKEKQGFQIESLVQNGLDKFSIITIELEPEQNKWENPQEIFESMNSLGKPLSLADLVRNYLLLGRSPEEQNELYRKFWVPMERELPQQVSNFIRDYMQVSAQTYFKKASDSNHKELYREFKALFQESNSSELLKSLAEYAALYSHIALGTASGSKTIDRYLRDFRTIKATTSYSFLLALLHEWKAGNLEGDDLGDIIEALLTFLIRRRIIAVTAPENKIIPALVQKIPDLLAAEDKRTETFKILSAHESNFRLPNDTELTRAIKTMNFYNFALCKFVLALVEESLSRSRPDIDEEKLQIEHVMPQHLNEAWRAELGPDCDAMHQELVNTIGNLTLIRHNQELGNKAFGVKEDIYANYSGLQIAKSEITNQKEWNREAIENRTDWLIKVILDDVLPIPESMKRANNFTAKESRRFSFKEIGLIGKTVNYAGDEALTAKVVNDGEVEFEGKRWRLSPLTREIETRKGTRNASGSYQGSKYWEFEGKRLSDLMEQADDEPDLQDSLFG